MRPHGLELVAALAAVILAGCDSGDDGSDGAPWEPSEVFIAVQVAASDDVTAKVFVTFSEPGAGMGTTHLLLNRGDTLNACVGAVCAPMTLDAEALRGASFVIPSKTYFAALPFVAETPYTVSLSRGGAVIAPNSVVTLPVPFSILAPPPGLPVTDGQYATVQWSPPHNGNVQIRGDAHCDHEGGARSNRRHSLGFQNVDTGTANISINELLQEGFAYDPSSLPQAPVLRCDIVLEVTQTRSGTVDNAFLNRNGAFANIARSVTIDYTPSQR